MCGILSILLSCCLTSGPEEPDDDKDDPTDAKPTPVKEESTYYGGQRTTTFDSILSFPAAPVVNIKYKLTRNVDEGEEDEGEDIKKFIGLPT